jgi:hypothetical protein
MGDKVVNPCDIKLSEIGLKNALKSCYKADSRYLSPVS